jgi:hypothetical protein
VQSAGKRRLINGLLGNVQHRTSNIPRGHAQEWLISAIPLALVELERIRAPADQIAPIGTAAPGRKAKTFRHPPPQHGAGERQHVRHEHGARITAISTRQNMPEPRNSATCEASTAQGSKLEPLWNRFGTINLMKHNDNADWFQSSKHFPSRICARACTRGHARITRG